MTEIYIHLERGEVYTNWIAIHDVWPDKMKQRLDNRMFDNYYENIRKHPLVELWAFSTVYLN